MSTGPSSELLTEIEALAADIARRAGRLLLRSFGKQVSVEYKDRQQRDPVSAADRECQELVIHAIRARFPDHGVLGEEDADAEAEARQTPDFVWVVDPLDGTKNFLSGLPIFACSVGVLHRMAPVAGAVFVPWPGEADGHVLHGRLGGGARLDGVPLSLQDAEPRPNRLVGLPAGFGGAYRFGAAMRGDVGEVRVTGSIAYEFAMVAAGVLQYAVTTAPRLWDVAAGTLLVQEAGGLAMVARSRGTPLWASKILGTGLSPRWKPLSTFRERGQAGAPTLAGMRRWSAPVAVGPEDTVARVTSGLRPRGAIGRQARRTVRRLLRRLRHGRDAKRR